MQTLLKILKNIIKGIFYIAVFLGLFILAVRFEVGSKSKSVSSSYTINQDTKIDPNSELAKYVTQEEIDDFAFRYWDIDFASNPKSVLKESDIDTNLKKLFKSKQTEQILKFMQDNNISVEYKLI